MILTFTKNSYSLHTHEANPDELIKELTLAICMIVQEVAVQCKADALSIIENSIGCLLNVTYYYIDILFTTNMVL
jgi:hypothetical protein